ncbi:zinc-dependent metalloprotease [Rubrivirga sp. S365]|uniref:zinc-dependent metalloprotease n=1 Tax=Rubrivirga sp. S365 TaxID=3076080 RepID=UPI0028C7BEC0|nr:zinc-dependent metalloprotease [Rubrivirga sp. S365]MDT7855056.1 zinc-dependent metalloprotease [Rubrivirga sp. S365]
MLRLLALVLLTVLAAGCATTTPPRPTADAPGGAALPTIAAKTAGMERRDGFLPVYWDAAAGKAWLEVPALDTDLLYVVSLAAGLGSNDVGLDRGQLGGERVVRFERVGPRVLLVQPNLRFRADTDNAAERLAVEDAFAPSVVWGFDVGAEGEGGAVLLDATDFVVRDAHGVAQRLKGTGQGAFALDRARSALVPAELKAFPQNTELEARLTFASDAPGRYVRDVAADPTAVTVRVRHSFVALPPPGYTPRPFRPASGYFPTGYADYAVPIGEEVERRFITRHRLQCAAPPDASGLCDPAEPIVYYLDPGTPEPVRGALLDGARWWADAFRAAGFRDAYRVEVRPDSVDPLDVRYNTIQWVHRATRGWSYGASVTDPRTGEILKGAVSLGSLRVRQDYLIAEGLLAPYTGENAAGFDPEGDPMLALALARLRQLSAHEVGHTIGLAHNFAASTQGRASVMDYPAPLAAVAEGGVDLSDAYGVGLGDWDVQAVRYGYTPDEGALPAILAETRARGLLFLTDADARPAGAASPVAALWDNGADAVAALRSQMAVRRAALDRFGEAAVREGRPLATLEEVLVPLYLGHRYQVEAASHLVGGVAYAYTERGDGSAPPAPVPGDVQRAALGALLEAVTPAALALPDAARLIPPRPPGYGATRELFDRRTGLTFDPVAPAETAATLVFGFLLDPDRAARLAYQPTLDGSLPGLADVLERTTTAVRTAPAATPYEMALRRATLSAWVDGLLGLAADDDAAPEVQAAAVDHALALGAQLSADGGGADGALDRWLADRIFRFLDREYDPEGGVERLDAPPGAPIGSR